MLFFFIETKRGVGQFGIITGDKIFQMGLVTEPHKTTTIRILIQKLSLALLLLLLLLLI